MTEHIAPPTQDQPVEVGEFLNVLDSSDPHALTACPARTVHLLAAHAAGNYREITRHVDAYLAGTPLMRTCTFDEREPEFRVMSPARLPDAIADGEARMRASIAELLEREPDPVLRWTSRQVHAAGFLKHSRSECAVHRWDIVGDDSVSEKLLSQEELFQHVVNFVGPLPMTARGLATGAGTGGALTVRLRAPGQPDLVIGVHRGVPALYTAPPEGTALLEGDPAARLLFLWGRRPTPFSRLRCNGTGAELSRVQWLLSGY
jgi:hypothetical protein